MSDLREAANLALSTLTDSRIGTWSYMEGSEIYNDFDKAADALRAALSAEPAQETKPLGALLSNYGRAYHYAMQANGRGGTEQRANEARKAIVDYIAANRASRLPEMGEGDWPAPSGYLVTEFGSEQSLLFDKPAPTVRDEVTGMTCEPLYTRAAVEALVRGKT